MNYRRWAVSWVTLTVTLAIHVVDETLTDFLDLWNPLVLRIRHAVPFVPLPTFDFEVWLYGLIAAVIILFCLTPLVLRGSRWLRPLSYAYGVIMLINGMGHLAASLYLGHAAPGAYSSPFLIIFSLFLLVSIPRGTRTSD